MRAIILAAGRGSRMDRLTDAAPKCFSRLAGRRLIDWQIASLRAAGIDDIAVVTGYQAQCFDYPLRYFHNPRWAQTNMVASLACAAEWLRRGPCLVSYSDIVYSTDPVTRLRDCDGALAISYDPNWQRQWQARFDDPLSDAESFELDQQGRLRSIGARVSRIEQIQGQYMGLLKFTPAGWGSVTDLLGSLEQPQVDALDMTALLARLLARGVSIAALPISSDWFEVDTAADLALCRSLLDQGRLRLSASSDESSR